MIWTFRRLYLILGLIYSHSLFSQEKENLVVNGDFSDNSMYITEDERRLLPYLDQYSTLSIRDFKGMFAYPYPDSAPYMGIKYGNGFLINHICTKTRKESIEGISEVYGTFKYVLKPHEDYELIFEYFPYWGTCLIQDSIDIILLDIKGVEIQNLKVFIGNDTPFVSKKVKISFINDSNAKYFKLVINTRSNLQIIPHALFRDSIVKNRHISIDKKSTNKSCCNCYTPEEYAQEEKMRRDSSFVYYLINGFSCYSTLDSSLICDTKIDTFFTGSVYFSPNSDSGSIEKLMRHRNSLDNKTILLKSYSDKYTDTMDIDQISLYRAINIKQQLEKTYNSTVSYETIGDRIRIENDPKRKLNRRVDIYFLNHRYVNCSKAKP